MHCSHVHLGNGVTAIVCGPKPRRKPCPFCHQTQTMLLCDWKVGDGKTCDAPMCAGCALHVGKDKDICPIHRLAYERWAKEQPQMALALKGGK